MSQATTNPKAGSENRKPATVKERADLALNNDFLRKAVRFTTERLRDGKQKAANDHGHWEEWRERGRQIRLHTIAHLDYYLNLFADKARVNGTHIHFAATGEEAVKIALEIAQRKQAASVVKSKSMVTEELHLNKALESIGVETIETDLGSILSSLPGKPRHISLFRRFIRTATRLPSCCPKRQERSFCPKLLSLLDL